MCTREIEIKNKTGLHARPASDLVKEAGKYKSDITIDFKGRTINAKSILNVLSAGICAGSIIKLSANGEDENEAVEKLEQVIKSFKE